MYTYGVCPAEVRIYNPQEKKLDQRIVNGYFIGYAEKSKGYSFYCPSSAMRIVKSHNAKFLENDVTSGSDQPRNLVCEENHISELTSESSDRLIIFQDSHQDLTIQEQSVIEEPHHHEDISIYLVSQPPQQENVDVTLRRSNRTRKPAISSDYIVYLQEADIDIGVEDDPATFSQAICESKYTL